MSTAGLTWKEWKKQIRAKLDATPKFDIETSRIDYLDLVANEEISVSVHADNTVGLDSQAKPEDGLPDRYEELDDE